MADDKVKCALRSWVLSNLLDSTTDEGYAGELPASSKIASIRAEFNSLQLNCLPSLHDPRVADIRESLAQLERAVGNADPEGARKLAGEMRLKLFDILVIEAEK
jgi:hypothetical protein